MSALSEIKGQKWPQPGSQRKTWAELIQHFPSLFYSFFTSAFNSQISYPQGTLHPDLEVWNGTQNTPPVIQVETFRELLLPLDCHKSMGLDGLHCRVLRELVEMTAELLSTIYQHSWLSGDVPENGRLADVSPIDKKWYKEDQWIYRPVGLTSVPEKIMQQVILGEITQHGRGIQEIRPSQHRFMKGRSCLTNLNSFYDWVTRLLQEGKAVDVV